MIGTARAPSSASARAGARAARNLVERDIDRLVVIGGDGSLSGADLLRHEWPALLAELVERGDLRRRQADRHPR